MNKRIWPSLTHMDGREQNFIKGASNTNQVVPLEPNMDAFEQSLTEYLHEDRHVVALSAGTAAFHLGSILLDIKPGDEAICQSFVFAASANPISYPKTKPVFVGSEKGTWNMDPVLLGEAIKDRLCEMDKLPKIIIPAYLYDIPAKMDEIADIAGHYGTPVLEDTTEALGLELNGRKYGTLGELATLFFSDNKMITTSGGDALICRTSEEVRQTMFCTTQACSATPYYQHTHIGCNYRMSNVCAGIGRGQVYVLEDHIAHRRTVHSLCVDLLKNVVSITIIESPDSRSASNFWLTCILVDPNLAGKSREDIHSKLDVESIETRPLWKPMHLQSIFMNVPFCENGTSGRLFGIGLYPLSGSTLTDEDIRKVVDTIQSV